MSLRAPPDQTRRYLIAYDIADDKRRLKVAKVLLKLGLRVQYSVFELRLDAEGIAGVVDALGHVIEPRLDRIDIVPICGSCAGSRRRLGCAEPEPPVWWVV